MSVLRSIVVVFSCFSSIPMPWVEWDKRSTRYAMAALPLVGVVIGAGMWLWWLLADALAFGTLLHAAGLTLAPIVITGGIHMDGFADVVDALSSHTEPKRKRQILKDPHVGAFAIIGICCYMLAYFALASEMGNASVAVLCCVPVASRCLCGFAAVTFRRSSSTGMLAAMSEPASARTVRVVLALVLAAVTGIAVIANPLAGLVTLVVAIGTLFWVRHVAQKEFGGMSGDLMGFYIQVAELAMLAGVVLAGKVA